jgi:hypothetical protein
VEQSLEIAERGEVCDQIEAYLRAWDLPEHEREELLAEVMNCADAGEALERVEELLTERMESIHPELAPGNLERALTPQRPPETYLTTMETSLTRLPSFRIVAGWFALIAGLIVAFIFTHQ